MIGRSAAARMALRRQLLSSGRHASRRALTASSAQVLHNLGISNTDSISGVTGLPKASGELLRSVSPATNSLLATVKAASADDVRQVVGQAVKAQKEWRNVPAPERGQVLRKIRNALDDKLDELGAIVTLEMGKIRSEGRGEIQECVDILDYAVGLSRQIGGSTFASERRKHRIIEVCNPLGTVGVISAFNFNCAVAMWNIALSLTCGNANVWKAAPTTPLSAIAMTKIIASELEKAGHDPALVSLVCGGAEAGSALVDDPRVDMISFTGSEARGREVGMRVASRFGKSLLELGGNNAAIVMPSANMKLALSSILFAALGTAGQRCTTTRRLFLHSDIANDFLEKLVTAYSSTLTRIGDPMNSDTLIGPLHTAQAVSTYEQAIKDAQAEGGRVLVGGKRASMQGELAQGNFVEPTIVYFDPAQSRDSLVMKKETFAPILYVTKVDSLQEAIARNNEVVQGLSSALFTNDVKDTFEWLGPEGSDTGIVNVNGSTSGAEIGAPFGGNKATGWGRESGGDAWKAYCRWASATISYSEELGLAQGVRFE